MRAVGVAQGTFYWHFPSKDDLVNAVVERFSEAMCADVATIASDSAIGAVEKLTRIRDAVLTPMWRERAVVEHVHREEHREFHDRVERETTRLLVAPLTRVIEQGVAEGTFSVEDPALAARMVAAMAGGLDELLDLGHVDLERTGKSLDRIRPARSRRVALAPHRQPASQWLPRPRRRSTGSP